MPRILGLDFGSKRLGFALSDPTEMLATPFRVTEYATPEQALRSVTDLCRETGAARLVVGLPLNMDGSRGPAVQSVLAFIEKLGPRIGIPIETWDERLSTKSATNVLIEAGASRARRKQVVDKLAAQLMLQNYLDAQATRQEEYPE